MFNMCMPISCSLSRIRIVSTYLTPFSSHGFLLNLCYKLRLFIVCYFLPQILVCFVHAAPLYISLILNCFLKEHLYLFWNIKVPPLVLSVQALNKRESTQRAQFFMLTIVLIVFLTKSFSISRICLTDFETKN